MSEDGNHIGTTERMKTARSTMAPIFLLVVSLETSSRGPGCLAAEKKRAKTAIVHHPMSVNKMMPAYEIIWCHLAPITLRAT